MGFSFRPRLGRASVGACVAAALLLAACGGGTTGTGADIIIGASIPISGPLAGFGSFVKWGYEHAVAKYNAQGGITLNGQQHKIKLVILDDQTNPNLVASNTDTLITKNRAVALLGSCTPALVNAGAVVADRSGIPLVTGCDPLEAFKSVKQWKYSWDIFFDEPDLAAAPFKLLNDRKIETNHKVAVLADNGPDGLVVGGQLWPMFAQQNGYTVAYKSSFPIDTTEFGSAIDNAKSAGADVVLVDTLTPNAVALRKQMVAHGYAPKVLVIEKGGEPVQFAQALGSLANGILVGGYWEPHLSYPGASQLRQQFESETGQTFSQHIADSDAAAEVLLDAIAKAGSTDPNQINDAIAATDKTYAVGPVKFGSDHTSKLAIVELQWQNGSNVTVWPVSVSTGSFLFPLPTS